eukprot:667315-Amphidinium_carterae.1
MVRRAARALMVSAMAAETADEWSSQEIYTLLPFVHVRSEDDADRVLTLLAEIPRDRRKAIAKSRLYKKLMQLFRDKEGNSLLHRAARSGNLQACRVLVEVLDVSLRQTNGAGMEPHEVTQSAEVAAYLHSHFQFQETRFGQGDAWQEALEKRESVMELEWRTGPLPGIAGRFGGCHSILLVTLRSGTTYLVEKASPHNLKEDARLGRNGVYVSHKLKAQGLKDTDMFKKLGSGQVKANMTMKTLIETAQHLGPYSLSSCN